eukprot:TRINITY_DN2114_c0_g2_i2.p1 TRINITY_DN2114_c0_g2~~TRINITY_DN2114_c0_g2_i2.p1  ORF type:complete len:279 (-),score=38.83 TRINITY_DN2114_c0_g2_i2:56-892(-)
MPSLVGSEMCIRDRLSGYLLTDSPVAELQKYGYVTAENHKDFLEAFRENYKLSEDEINFPDAIFECGNIVVASSYKAKGHIVHKEGVYFDSGIVIVRSNVVGRVDMVDFSEFIAGAFEVRRRRCVIKERHHETMRTALWEFFKTISEGARNQDQHTGATFCSMGTELVLPLQRQGLLDKVDALIVFDVLVFGAGFIASEHPVVKVGLFSLSLLRQLYATTVSSKGDQLKQCPSKPYVRLLIQRVLKQILFIQGRPLCLKMKMLSYRARSILSLSLIHI